MSDKTALELCLYILMNARGINWNRERTIIYHKGNIYKLMDIADKLIDMLTEVMEDETEQ